MIYIEMLLNHNNHALQNACYKGTGVL